MDTDQLLSTNGYIVGIEGDVIQFMDREYSVVDIGTTLNTEKAYHYNCIDLVKYILSYFVIAIHFHPFTSYSKILDYGFVHCIARIAVPYFFIVSAFFCFKKNNISNFNATTSYKYVCRLLKKYLIWSLIYFIPAYKQIINDQSNYFKAFLIWVRNMIFVGSYRQLWYLNATALAVLLLTILLKRNIRLKTIVFISFVLYLMGLFGQSYFGLLKPFKSIHWIWVPLRSVGKIFVTTRNGLFEGLLFISIGAYLSFKPILIKMKRACIYLLISIFLLVLEAYYTAHFHLVREQDMYIMLVPTAFLLFYISACIQLPENNIYLKLRERGALLFYIHTLVGWVTKKSLSIMAEKMGYKEVDSLLLYICVVLLSLVSAEIIIYLSKKQKFRILSVLYL